jgi:hypothetical protein
VAACCEQHQHVSNNHVRREHLHARMSTRLADFMGANSLIHLHELKGDILLNPGLMRMYSGGFSTGLMCVGSLNEDHTVLSSQWCIAAC